MEQYVHVSMHREIVVVKFNATDKVDFALAVLPRSTFLAYAGKTLPSYYFL